MTFVVLSILGFSAAWLKPEILNYSEGKARTAMIGFAMGTASFSVLTLMSKNLLKHQNKLAAAKLETKL